MLNLKVNILRAALLHAADKSDLRYCLRSVCLEFAGPVIYAIATNGHSMFAAIMPRDETGGPVTGNSSMMIPSDAIATALKGVPKKQNTILLAALPDGRYSLGDTIFATVDGNFPDWARVVPSSLSGETAQYNPEYLMKAKQSFYFMGYSNVNLQHNGPSSALLTAPDCLCVVMPMRPDTVCACMVLPSEAMKAA